jgi:parallel beta-helix repeat protein
MRTHTICLTAALSLLTSGCQTDADLASPSLQPHSGVSYTSLSPLPEVILACGASVVSNLKLANDLNCPGDALMIDADGVTLDLNGHVVTGSGMGNGITVRARRDIVIRGGTIASFVTGIFVAQSSNVTITDNYLTLNREAVFLNGSTDNVLKHNQVGQNQLRGFMLRPTNSGLQSTGNLVQENVLWDNPSGILVFGQPGNTFKENRISQSTFAAFDLTGGGASGNLIKENVLETSAAGIRFGPGWSGNTIKENRLLRNTCAVQGTSTGNTLRENILAGNTFNVC